MPLEILWVCVMICDVVQACCVARKPLNKGNYLQRSESSFWRKLLTKVRELLVKEITYKGQKACDEVTHKAQKALDECHLKKVRIPLMSELALSV